MRRQKVAWKEDQLICKDVCFECGSTDCIHYHHVVPEVLGGKRTLPLCLICHGKVHGRDFLRAKELQRAGIEKAKAEGRYIGRRVGTSDSDERLLSKPRSKRILELLQSKPHLYIHKGGFMEIKDKYSYEEISKLVPCSRTTIVKVKKAYDRINKNKI